MVGRNRISGKGYYIAAETGGPDEIKISRSRLHLSLSGNQTKTKSGGPGSGRDGAFRTGRPVGWRAADSWTENVIFALPSCPRPFAVPSSARPFGRQPAEWFSFGNAHDVIYGPVVLNLFEAIDRKVRRCRYIGKYTLKKVQFEKNSFTIGHFILQITNEK